MIATIDINKNLLAIKFAAKGIMVEDINFGICLAKVYQNDPLDIILLL